MIGYYFLHAILVILKIFWTEFKQKLISLFANSSCAFGLIMTRYDFSLLMYHVNCSNCIACGTRQSEMVKYLAPPHASAWQRSPH